MSVATAEGQSPRPKEGRRRKAWLYGQLPTVPFWGLLSWLLWRGGQGTVALDLPHLLLVGAIGAAWLAGQGLWPQALLFALLLAPLGHDIGWNLPRVGGALSAHHPGDHLWVEGTVRRQHLLPPGKGARTGSPLRLHLGEVQIFTRDATYRVAEAEVEFPRRGQGRVFLYRQRVRLGGTLARTEAAAGRLRLWLAPADFHVRTPPIGLGERLRAGLRDRAAYYLTPAAQAVYLPVMLGVRDRRLPAYRAIEGAFRRVGVAHLLAISGLHVGLLFLILMVAQHGLLQRLLPGPGWVYRREAIQLGVMVALWGYIALIGFPIPAVRAGAMGSMLLLNDLGGIRSPRLYVLSLAALLLLALAPTQLYDLSFQLSFLAYLILVQAIGGIDVLGGYRRDRPWLMAVRRMGRFALVNLGVTLAITVGMWPLLAGAFGKLSLLVFLGNLLLLPLLTLVVLPGALIAFLTSLAHLGAPPGAWSERLVFGILDLVLHSWLWMLEALDALAGKLVITVTLDWSPRSYFFYYGGLLFILLSLGRLRRKPGRAAKPRPAEA